MVTNEQVYLLTMISMLSNAIVTLIGFVFLEVSSNARERRSNGTSAKERSPMRE